MATIQSKTCCNCQVKKPITDFPKDRSRSDGFRPECKECKCKRDKIYRENNIEKKKEMDRKYCKENAEKQREKARKWYYDNKKTNRSFQIRKAIKSRMGGCGIEDCTDASVLKYLDCSVEYFQQWIEYQFDENMMWENHGDYWQYDHVKPCANYDFDKEEDRFECFNWKNIRPLEERKNIQKGDIIDNDIINEHNEILNEFLNLNVPNIIGNDNIA
jgi:hypothetical protein